MVVLEGHHSGCGSLVSPSHLNCDQKGQRVGMNLGFESCGIIGSPISRNSLIEFFYGVFFIVLGLIVGSFATLFPSVESDIRSSFAMRSLCFIDYWFFVVIFC